MYFFCFYSIILRINNKEAFLLFQFSFFYFFNSAFCFSPFLSNFAECPNIISITCITFHHLRFPPPPEPSRRHMPTPIPPSSDRLSANASQAYHRLQAAPPALCLKNFPIQRFRFVLLDNPMLLLSFSHLRIWIVHSSDVCRLFSSQKCIAFSKVSSASLYAFVTTYATHIIATRIRPPTP